MSNATTVKQVRIRTRVRRPYVGRVSAPVQVVRDICQQMAGAQRQDVIRTCVEKGVNPHTAATQYQRWFAEHLH